MDQTHLLDSIPLWGLFLATVAIVILSVEAGFRLGRFRRLRYVDGFAAGHGVMRSSPAPPGEAAWRGGRGSPPKPGTSPDRSGG